jgi:hypothetical protein
MPGIQLASQCNLTSVKALDRQLHRLIVRNEKLLSTLPAGHALGQDEVIRCDDLRLLVAHRASEFAL